MSVIIAMELPRTDYDPDQFPGLVYQPDECPRTTVLIFRSGEIVCTGAASVEGVHEAIHATFDDLGDLGVQIPANPPITVQNIVMSADLGQPLNLNAIAIGVGLETIEYEPEQFPGLVYRLDDPDVVVLLFGTGKLVITGGTTTEQAETALDTITDRLRELDLFD
jgi:transcription initiation factor TFIID TATA-box-binding protein